MINTRNRFMQVSKVRIGAPIKTWQQRYRVLATRNRRLEPHKNKWLITIKPIIIEGQRQMEASAINWTNTSHDPTKIKPKMIKFNKK